MTRQLLSNTNYLTDCNKTSDLVLLRLILLKNDKDFILVTPSSRQAQEFSNDLVLPSIILTKYVQKLKYPRT